VAAAACAHPTGEQQRAPTHIRPELERDHPTGRDSDVLVVMATLKRVRLTESS
jgi:hypothetical protein